MDNGQLTAAPVLIGHRGNCGYRPENTLLSFAHAIDQGADMVELDIVPTRDGALVVRHDAELSITTDVADHPEFAGRRRSAHISGVQHEGWFTTDFTLAELKTLHAVERNPTVRKVSAGYREERVPTLAEVLDLLAGSTTKAGERPGIRIEVKNPTYFASLELPVEDRLAAVLAEHRADVPIIIQSFEVDILRRIGTQCSAPVLQLMTELGGPPDQAYKYVDMATPAGLAEIATYAVGIGPDKPMIAPRGDGAAFLPATSLVRDAHAVGLFVNPYTFRDENAFLAAPHRIGADPSARGDGAAECRYFFDLGVDGLFTDFVDTAFAARTTWLADHS